MIHAHSLARVVRSRTLKPAREEYIFRFPSRANGDCAYAVELLLWLEGELLPDLRNLV